MKRALPILLLCQCFIPNPWFGLLDDSAGTSTSQTSTSTRETDQTPTGSETGTPGSSGSSGMLMATMGSSETTLGSSGEPTTGHMGSSSSSTTGTSSASTGISSSSSGEGDTTTGEGALFKDLYELCPVPGVAWLGGKALNIPLECNGGDKPGVSQIPFLNILGKNKSSILNMSPTIEPMGALEGRYPFAPLSPQEAMTAKVLAEIHCPVSPNPQKPCEAYAKIVVEVNKVPLGSVESPLKDGNLESLQLDLASVQAVVDGEAFDIVLHVDVGEGAGDYDRVYFIGPRVSL